MTLPEHIFVVDAEVDPSVEAAWNEWYNKVHLPEITACPGFRQSARYVSEQGGGRHYLALYELDRPEALHSTEFNQRRGWREFTGKVKWTSRLYRRIAAAPSAIL
jgi:antibiotic biosynthesis monooxygenase (ABM) superfamily enzyme